MAVSVGSIASFHIVEAVGVAPSILDLAAERGSTVARTVSVINTADEKRSFTTSIEPFVPNDDGSVRFGEGDDEVLSWITWEPHELELASQDVGSVQISASIPASARPGDYHAAILVKESGQGVSAVTALLLFLTVQGPEIIERGEIVSFTRSEISIQNSGNVYLKPEGEIRVSSWIGSKHTVPLNPNERRVLPGNTRAWPVEIESAMKARGFISIGPVTVSAVFRSGNETLDTARIVLWHFSWHTILVPLILLLLVAFVYKRSRRSSPVWHDSNA